jgi:syntaxin 16
VKEHVKKLNDSENIDNKKKQAIEKDITSFDKALKDLKIELSKEENNNNNEAILMTRNYVDEVERDVSPIVQRLKEKIQYFIPLVERSDEDNREEENQQQKLVIQDLSNNEEILKQRGKELNEIHQISSQINEMTNEMSKKVVDQGIILDKVEDNVIQTEKNATEAKKEIIKADEMSRSNRKRMMCYIIIIVVAILAIGSILLSLLYGGDK